MPRSKRLHEILVRLVGDSAPIRLAIEEAVAGLAKVRFTLEIPFMRMRQIEGLPTMVAAFTTDIPALTNWGEPLLLGPGSIHVAHTPNERIAKKEALGLQREMQKLQRSLGGIKELNSLPDALFIIDVGYQKIAVTEANKLSIPIIGVVDTNHSPEGIAYVIPGNDDSSRAIRLYARGVADAILEGRSQVIQEIVQTEEFVEISGDEARS